ncbi:sulfurtransferase [Phycisphaera mikurensis]|uniref:Putative thiosulfate sulfurtransferase n=1 Tax=Phycisphaera mikurensis (strain NBRC 102666 / KCTC 22515 / FYK2301M01) TaxID=1142394 RepID=I0IIN4_PHYMF|nr:rhodanese-like domain-containing protein [Phycisphaera mikurensis]MBB6442726.1 thiosulfate/3-mercaptopyruvate sulfurtransferase [Phycisphaera mikurensis]BAM05122.1 putative thiosulfate sulfurtransferase [Phycisphaera mikurensis NBRC 102666]
MIARSASFALLACGLLLAACSSTPDAPWSQRHETFLAVEEVAALAARPGVVLVDARDPEAFAAGHLPGAVNLPPAALRSTGDDPRGKNLLFRLGGAGPEERRIDAERYAELLGAAGISADDTVIAYGNHAGQADGSTVLMILDLLGHRGDLRFLDGVGVDRWTAAGHELAFGTPAAPAAKTYQARPREGAIWTAREVAAAAGDPGVVLWDTRSTDEFTGVDRRKNARGGHLAGAKHLDYAALLDAENRVKPADHVASERDAAGVAPADLAGKTVVLYCQSATRVSLPYLLLREEGAERVAVYDGSMQEWLNDERYPVETGG